MSRPCFVEAFPLSAPGAEPADAVLFGAPHGTPYPGLDNRVHARSAAAIRDASQAEGDGWAEHWNFDVGGPLLGPGGFRLGDLGDLPTTPSEVMNGTFTFATKIANGAANGKARQVEAKVAA